MFSEGKHSQREEVLLDLQSTAVNQFASVTNIPGSGALRVGRWKLLHGHQGVFAGNCTLRGPFRDNNLHSPLPIFPNETAPWCPYGWTPPPRADGHFQVPQPPPIAKSWGGNCTKGELPCNTPSDAGFVAGETMLFDVVNDMEERYNLAWKHPEIVQRLLERLQSYNNTHCLSLIHI